ncbi:MAG: hypothetical protein QM820_35660 [Minicystis sp.]
MSLVSTTKASAWLAMAWLAALGAAGCGRAPAGGDAPAEPRLGAATQALTLCSDGIKDGTETGVDCGGSCGKACLAIPVDGHADVLVGCSPNEYDCQARLLCGGITGLACVYQEYDCASGYWGSYFPPDGASGDSNFNFAVAYDFYGGNYGNICACDVSQMSRYGLEVFNEPCGVSHWTRVGDGDCVDGVQNRDEEDVDCGGLDCEPCPSCSDGIQNGWESGVDCGGPCAACPSCYDGIQNQGEAGVDCGGPCTACVSCHDHIQNQGELGVDCGGPCAACPTCSDHIQNQGELGVDCGGPCAACPTCSDHIKNQGETGIDCGGPCTACQACTDGVKNGDETDVDCGGSLCDPCPSCSDGIQNQGEAGVDCGGPCALACPAGCTTFYDASRFSDYFGTAITAVRVHPSTGDLIVLAGAQLYRVSSAGQITEIPYAKASWFDVEIDGAGLIYYVGYYDALLHRTNVYGWADTALFPVDPIFTFGQNGRWYSAAVVAVSGGYRYDIFEFDITSGVRTKLFEVPVQAQQGAKLRVDAAGRVYVSTYAGTLYRYDSTTQVVAPFATAKGAPAIELDTDGNVYCAGQVLNPSGTLIARYPAQGSSAGLAMDAQRNLYVGENTVSPYVLSGGPSSAPSIRKLQACVPCAFSSATLVAGDETHAGSVDGQGSAARIGSVMAMRTDPSTNDILFQDGSSIRRLTTAGQVTTIASGRPFTGYAAFGVTQSGQIYYRAKNGLHRLGPGGADTQIPITPALPSGAPYGAFTVGSDGNGYLAYFLGTPGGAGVARINLTTGARTDLAALSDVSVPVDVALDRYGRLWIADPNNQRTRVLATGQLPAARRYIPGMTWSVTADGLDNVLVNDSAYEPWSPITLRRFPSSQFAIGVDAQKRVYVPRGNYTSAGWAIAIHAFPASCGN